MTLTEQLRAARLSLADMGRLSHGVLSESKLKKHNSGERALSPEDRQLAHRIIAAHRMATEKAHVVVFEAISGIVDRVD